MAIILDHRSTATLLTGNYYPFPMVMNSMSSNTKIARKSNAGLQSNYNYNIGRNLLTFKKINTSSPKEKFTRKTTFDIRVLFF